MFAHHAGKPYEPSIARRRNWVVVAAHLGTIIFSYVPNKAGEQHQWEYNDRLNKVILVHTWTLLLDAAVITKSQPQQMPKDQGCN